MDLEYAFVAESADVQGGLFYVMRGGSDIWYTRPEATFPARVGPMSFLVRLAGDPGEVGAAIPVSFVVVDVDGRSIGAEGAGEIAFPPHPFDRTRSGGALMHFRLDFDVPAPGAYFFELHHPQGRICQVPFWIITAPPPEPGA